MSSSIIKTVVLSFLGVVLLSACATAPKVEGVKYDSDQRIALYDLVVWEFQGRVAVQSAADSWHADIRWRHVDDTDSLLLSGPLGQGAVAIKMTGDRIQIDRGKGQVEVSDDPDTLISRRVGTFVPVSALRYWVLGLPVKHESYSGRSDGFQQSGWAVLYSQWMQVQADTMPHKISVQNQEIKLKLVVDEWVLSRNGVR